MLRTGPKQLSLYSLLYDNIPENHILKTINNAIDLKFVNKLLQGSYCQYYGRPAKEPEMMLRIQILKYLYNLSDEQLIQDLAVNLAYKWFVGLNPEDPLPEVSLLTKFRTQRLKDISMDVIITEIVRQCVERGIIKSNNGIVIDTTHIEANTIKKVPERIIKQLARKIFKAMGQEEYEIPDYTQIEDHAEAKQVMKDYLENLIEQVDQNCPEEVIQAAKEAKEILASDLFIEQKGENRTQECRVEKISWIRPSQRLRSKKCSHTSKTNSPGGKFKADSQDGIRSKKVFFAYSKVFIPSAAD